MLALLIGVAATRPGGTAAQAAAGRPGPGDWPMFLHDAQRQGWNGDETVLSPATAPFLRLKWKVSPGGVLVASPAVVGDTVYEGTWDGPEVALDAGTGQVRWRVDLGVTTAGLRQCRPAAAGVTSGAAIGDGFVYVGGGLDYFYALDAATGRPAWRQFTGAGRAGSYNWASPALDGGRIYSGIASFCDHPFVRGYMWSANAAMGTDRRDAYTVGPTHIGGGFWTSPTIDSAHHRAFGTTGSGPSPGYIDSIVAVDLNTYTVSDAWRVPPQDEGADPDWSTTPTLFTLPDGRELVAGGNKDGYVYVFDANHLAAGPLWQFRVAHGGECPQCGEGTIASGVYHDGVLYLSGGHTTVAGQEVGGAIRAFDAASGRLLWEHATPGPILGSPAGANGVLVVPVADQIQVIEAATGRTLTQFKTGAVIWGAAVIAHGVVYVPSTDRSLYAFEIAPDHIPAAPPATSTPPVAPSATPPPATPSSPPAPAALQPVPAPSGGDITYFAATGHTLIPPLRDYWQRYGGLTQFGYPLSEPFDEALGGAAGTPGPAYRVQYFERARFEYHPEYAGTPSAVLLGLLGVQFHPPDAAVAPSLLPGAVYLNGHNLSGIFLHYWQAHGGLFVNGYPIAEVHDEVSPTDGHSYRVQYFERARFEAHPEQADPAQQVQLGLLGVQLLRARGWLP